MWIKTNDQNDLIIHCDNRCTGIYKGISSDKKIVFTFQGNDENLNAYYNNEEERNKQFDRIQNLLINQQSDRVDR